MKAFKMNHFGKKKMVQIVLESSINSRHSDEGSGLTVVNEHTIEETKSSGATNKNKLNIIKRKSEPKKTSHDDSDLRNKETNYFGSSNKRSSDNDKETVSSYFTL